jgi:transposase-like protein
VVSEAIAPRAGREYPGTWQAFEEWFPDDAACRSYLESLRWPDGFVCPQCRSVDAWRTDSKLFMCSSCGRQTSVTAGTIFHRTRKPLKTWFAVIWFVCAQKNGASAKSLQQMFGFGSYETAWTWMHKIRRAMVRPDRDLLGGAGIAVELDETFIGGRSPAESKRFGNKTEVVIAVERLHPKGLGRVRMRQIDSKNRKLEIFDFIDDVIAPGTILYTDGASTYNDIKDQFDVTHEPINLVGGDELAHDMLPAVHRIASLVKRWIAGTLHHGQSSKHLDYYLDEYTFRFNRRNSRSRGMLFYRLLQQAVNTDPHPLKELTQSDDWS